VVFALHPVVDGERDGPVEDPVARWTPGAEPEAVRVAEDLPAGGYLLVGSYAAIAENSRKVHFCLGDEASTAACVPLDTADSGGGDSADPPDLRHGVYLGGCTCSAAGGRGSAWPSGRGMLAGALLALGLLARRRG